MQKIKSQYILEDTIMKDIAWRKKELTTLLFDYLKASPKKKDYYWRIGVIFIYSHWEGFIKKASISYLLYLVSKGYKLSELKKNFQVLLVQYKKENFKSKKYSNYDSLLEFINNLDQKFILDPEEIIDTNSNLNFSALLEILLQLNIEKKEFELREKYIERLIEFRNMIAHGEYLSNTESIFSLEQLRNEILYLLEHYMEIIINESSTKGFLKNSL